MPKNYSEVCVRIFKDNVLSRVRAYNVKSLVDFVCTALETYYRHRFREFAYSRDSSARLLLQRLMKSTEYIKTEDIVQISAVLFQVPSSCKGSSDSVYLVDCDMGCCTCAIGLTGKF